MGSSASSNTEVARTQIIDIIYKDIGRVESYFSQINCGTIKSITRKHYEITNSATEIKGGIEQIATGKKLNSSENGTEQNSVVDLYDHKIIKLLDILGIEHYNGDVNQIDNHKLILLSGQLKLRNYTEILNTFPKLAPFIPGLEEVMNFDQIQLQKPNNHSKNKNKQPKHRKDSASSIFQQLINLIPSGAEIELITNNNQSIIGAVKPNCLVDSLDDMQRIFGISLPGEWNVLGIYNKRKLSNEIASKDSLMSILDSVADTAQKMYNNSPFRITPILIYRELT